jgi:hypothetical protein
MPSPFIPDGYTRETTLPACELWDEIQLAYRPMAAADFAEYLAKSKGLDEAGWTRLVCDLIAAKVTSWNIAGPSGEAVPVSVDSVKRLVNPLVLKLWTLLCGAVESGDTAKN